MPSWRHELTRSVVPGTKLYQWLVQARSACSEGAHDAGAHEPSTTGLAGSRMSYSHTPAEAALATAGGWSYSDWTTRVVPSGAMRAPWCRDSAAFTILPW